MKKLANAFLIILIIGGFIIYNKTNTKPTYTITPDTNVSKVKGLSKYVTQEEVDDFSFRYWDIDSNYTKDIPPNLIPLRAYLKQKDTNKIINYIKEHNLSIDIKIQDNTTPLMYSSFYNDLNTSNKLINLGANIRAKDRYGLSPLAYAIENNSTKTVKLLLDRGVKASEIYKVQTYLFSRAYFAIKKIEIDENNSTKIFYEYNDGEKNINSKDGSYFMFYVAFRNFTEMLDIILESGYIADKSKWDISLSWLTSSSVENMKILKESPFSIVYYLPNYKPLLELLLKYNVYGKPTKEELKRAYEYCYEDFISETKRFNDYIDKLKSNQILDKKTTTDDIVWKIRIDNNIQYCSDKNSTFTIREYFAWANKDEKVKQLFSFNRQHSDQVFYTQSNSTKEINSTNKK